MQWIGFRSAMCLAAIALLPNTSQAGGGSSGCSLKSATWGSYSYGETEIDDISLDVESHGPAVALAGLIDCGNINAQLNLLASGSFISADPGSDSLEAFGGAGRGILFWRDPSLGATGVMLGYGLTWAEASGGDEFNYDTGRFGVGLFGHYFAGEMLTFSLAGQYEADDSDVEGNSGIDVIDVETWSIDATAKLYVSQRAAALVSAGYAIDDFEYGVDNSEQIRLSVGIEYLFPDCNLSAFVLGHAGLESLTFEGDEGPGVEIDSTALTATVGLRYDFGPASGSLVERDRSGPVSPLLLP